MERYFFHLFDDIETRDEEGMVLPDVAAARRHALSVAREMMCDQIRKGRLDLGHRIEVEDGRGAPVLTLTFAGAVRVEN